MIIYKIIQNSNKKNIIYTMFNQNTLVYIFIPVKYKIENILYE